MRSPEPRHSGRIGVMGAGPSKLLLCMHGFVDTPRWSLVHPGGWRERNLMSDFGGLSRQ